ncbi:FAD-dependent monooxygenase [Glycomyces arizonensis]|uniref:FAD-dependent monooxygenase n=1 Tax=Glycomyces arizonensis TaxID=256035 RepID=UPI0003F54AD6|nr:FAD-dependent monooxygenase [Glycomyces arizonensis]
MADFRILISGASIAGNAAAYWLRRYGCEVTVVERAPALRPGGQAVDFKGETHRKVLEQMGVLADIERRQTGKTDLNVVDEENRTQAVIPGEFIGGDVEILRGDLADILYQRTSRGCEFLFNDTITALRDTGAEVEVDFEQSSSRSFDLVIGADGLHSRTRRLAFGPEKDFVEHLGYYYAVAGANTGHGAADGRAVGYMYNTPGRLALLGGSKAPDMFVFASPELDLPRRDVAAQQALLRERYSGLGWKVPEMLDRLGIAGDFYFDSISRVRMDRYTNGRVALVGDSAYGNTLGGFGTGLAIVGGYVLAGELARAGWEHAAAFAEYDQVMHRYAGIARKGNAGPFMAPASPMKIKMRNWSFTNPLMFKLMMKMTDSFATKIDLRDYPAPQAE